MRISNEAKILFGIMIAAALALFSAQFFFQNGGSFNSGGADSGSLSSSRPSINEPDTATIAPEVAPGISVAPGGSALDDAIDSTAPNTAAVPLDEVAPLDGITLDDPVVDAPSVDGVTVEGSSADDLVDATNADAGTGVSVEGAEDALTEEGIAAAPVAAAPLAPSAARDVEIVTLPFLVTEPPTSEEALAQDADANTINRPGEQRLSVNPFSPILLQAVEAPAPAASVPNDIPEVTVVDVPIPAAPPAPSIREVEVAAPPSPETAPPLRTFTPPTPVAATLPRPLPSGTLPATPGILRRAQPAASDQASATLRLPGSTAESLPTSAAASEPISEASDDLPALQGADASAAPRDCGPVAAGACTLSVYLRDQNVRFTGYVIGPVGVGVFRINGRSAPLVLPIGQNLLESEDTDIVLTSLEGKQAEFTRGNETQFLTLDFRR